MKTMTPSEMTDRQVNKSIELYAAMLRKHSGEFSSESVQQVLGDPNFVGDMVRVFRSRVEAISNMIVRHVKVDRSHTPQQVLDATGRRQYTNQNVVDAMPHGEGGELDIFFFHPGRYINDEELEKEVGIWGLKPADPYSLAQVNIDDPAFTDTHPNGTHWKDAKGDWCFAAFSRWGGERFVDVFEHGYGWGNRWWFAGVRK